MATTHWDSAELESPGAGDSREGEFRTKFWKDILDEGAVLERIEDYNSDPDRIIDEILRKAQETEIRKRGLQIQEELVDKEKKLTDTEAGKKLRYTLEEIKEILKQAPVQSMEEQRQAMVNVQEQLDNFETRWFDKLKGAFGRLKRGSVSRR
jgi:FtsZ-binding cell division protein ZapB